MDAVTRIEQALTAALDEAGAPGCPPGLAAAVRHAVFPRGGRIRPRLCLAVARACGEDAPALTDAAAAAIELLHCASLIHDDLPCFDDAPVRRGKPAVHRAFGEPLAVLAGDALIVLAFETLAREAPAAPLRAAALVRIVARAVGMPGGIVAGQAWECESCVELDLYQQAKTGALFAGAAMAGAAAAGVETAPWRGFGQRLGLAYQVADDIRDVAGDPEDLGKPIGQDVARDRRSAARDFGLGGAIARLDRLVTGALDAIPACPGAAELRTIILMETKRFLPKELALSAA
jgi:geranylgeranyl diphosphate synthase, type II